MRKFTVGTLTTAVRRRADIPVADDHVSDAEIREWLSAFYAELYDILTASGMMYFEKERLYESRGSSVFALPHDFYATLYVHYVVDDNSDFLLKEISPRDVWKMTKQASSNATYYRVAGQTLLLYPPPLADQVYRLKYIPAPEDLSAANMEVDGVAGWEDYLVTGACSYALAKKDRDTSFCERRLAALRKRITDAALNREIASATSLVESPTRGFDPFLNDPAEWRTY